MSEGVLENGVAINSANLRKDVYAITGLESKPKLSKHGLRRFTYKPDPHDLGLDPQCNLETTFITLQDERNEKELTRKSPQGILELLYHWKIPIDVETQDLLGPNYPKSEHADYVLLEGVTAASLIDNRDVVKEFDDCEGWALLTAYCLTKKSNPAKAQEIRKELFSRAQMLHTHIPDVEAAHRPASQVLTEQPSWGEVPFTKIWCTHTTDFPPAVGDESVGILPRIDTDGVARNTVHTFTNGVVEPHGIVGISSWEDKPYAIMFNFGNTISFEDNILPTSAFRADTYWELMPGQGLKLSPGSYIIAPDYQVPTYKERYGKFGIQIHGYSADTQTVRDTTKELFSTLEVPFMEHIDPKVPSQEDTEFAQRIGVKSRRHESSIQEKMEGLFIAGQKSIDDARAIMNKDGLISIEESRKLGANVRIAADAEGRPCSEALSCAVDSNRRSILESARLINRDSFFNKDRNPEVTIKGLVTALEAGLI